MHEEKNELYLVDMHPFWQTTTFSFLHGEASYINYSSLFILRTCMYIKARLANFCCSGNKQAS